MNRRNGGQQYETGVSGERQALMYLQEAGMTPVAERFRGGEGEIDLVMDDDGTLVMV